MTSRILVVGDVILDMYHIGQATRISPEAPVPVVSVKKTEYRAGGAANVANNIAHLGCEVDLLGVTGVDSWSEKLSDSLHSKVTFRAIGSLSSTLTKLRLIAGHQQLARVDFPEEIPGSFNRDYLLETYKKLLQSSNIIIFSDYNKGTLIDIEQMIQFAKDQGKTVLVDPKGTCYQKYSHADLIKPNQSEFESVVSKTCSTVEQIESSARDLINQYQIGTILVTRGSDGMVLVQKSSIHESKSTAKHVYDVTGAGDTVIATLAVMLNKGESLKESVEISNKAAGIVVSKIGTSPVTEAELNGNSKLTDLQACLEQTRGKRIVFTNGCFDILHAGHVSYLKQAKQLGDILIVGINDDQSIKKLKGHCRPIHNLKDRIEVLSELSCVDFIIPFVEDTPINLITSINPDILVKGGDYTKENIIGSDFVENNGGKVVIIPTIESHSTTRIINESRSN